MPYEILTNAQMAALDRKTIENGIDGFSLMQRAGQAVADHIITTQNMQPVLILCGPGNNGGDGFVIGKILQDQGWPVELCCLAAKDKLKGDALKAAEMWNGDIGSFDTTTPQNQLIIDSVFGTGFSSSLPKQVSSIFQKIQNSTVIAVDMPSGVNGDTGDVCKHTLKADQTITFHRKKLGHVLYPGAEYCGKIHIADIGITQDEDYAALENHPDLWLQALPKKTQQGHKYHSGHTLIYGAPELMGATRLAAETCARMGSGLVSVLATPDSAPTYRAALPACILVREDMKYEDDRISARIYGPGGLPTQPDFFKNIPTVIDAEALQHLPATLNNNYVLTPHEGEFSKAFPSVKGPKIQRAQEAAQKIQAHIVLKGPDTVIVSSDARHTVINTNTSPHLATAGTGDVLAGMIGGLLAQGMNPFEASCAATWIHGECAKRKGRTLIADDLADLLPKVLEDLEG